MDSSSVQNLCQHLISLAIQRCRMLDDLCRLSIVIKSSSVSNRPRLQISISDTGVGSCMDDFPDVKYPRDPNFGEMWDGVISVATTGTSDKEIYHYNLNVKETDVARRLIKLPSKPKNGAIFSGTEVSLRVSESFNELLVEITYFFRKILILKIPVAVELVVDCAELPGLQYDSIILANECTPLPTKTNIECLKLGLEDYILKHGMKIDSICESCFPSREYLKSGSGFSCHKESNRNSGMVIEAVIIISQSSQIQSPCLRVCGTKTKVLYFKDFSPCSVSQSSLNALASIDWKKYGLMLKDASDIDGCLFLEWENLPPDSHIDIAIHCYHTQVMLPSAKKNRPDQNLTRKAVKLAMDDLKEKNAGFLLSAHAAKICSYAPDLARTMAGLILTSNDLNFQDECISLLGLQYQERETNIIEKCIKEKIISVIQLDDKRPQKSRGAAPFLFEDETFEEPEFMEAEYEEDSANEGLVEVKLSVSVSDILERQSAL